MYPIAPIVSSRFGTNSCEQAEAEDRQAEAEQAGVEQAEAGDRQAEAEEAEDKDWDSFPRLKMMD